MLCACGHKIKQKMMPALSSVKQALALIYLSAKKHIQLVSRFSPFSIMNDHPYSHFNSKKHFVVLVSNNERVKSALANVIGVECLAYIGMVRELQLLYYLNEMFSVENWWNHFYSNAEAFCFCVVLKQTWNVNEVGPWIIKIYSPRPAFLFKIRLIAKHEFYFLLMGPKSMLQNWTLNFYLFIFNMLTSFSYIFFGSLPSGMHPKFG